MSDPAPGPDLAAVGRLCRWVEDHFGGGVALVGEPTSNGAGFDAAIWFVQLTGPELPDAWRRPLVLRIKPDPDRLDVANREAEIHRWLVDRHFPSPRILTVLDPGVIADGPAQVMERMPGTMMLDALLGAPWRAPAAIRTLADAHVAVHRLDPEGFPPTDDLLDARLRLTRATADVVDVPALRRALDATLALAPRMRDASPSVCHGDFHPLNLVLDDAGEAAVLDWTDAGIGDRHGDVARTILLFHVAAIAASNAVEREALRRIGPVLARRYRRHYERSMPLDDERLALWTPVHLLHGWSQALGVVHGLFGADEPDRFVALASELEARFERALAAVA